MIDDAKLSDLTITHKATNTTWNLHSQAFCRSDNAEHNTALITALENSEFTTEGFRDFLGFFYKLKPDLQHCSTACHWEAVLEQAGYQSPTLLRLISRFFSNDECLEILLLAWFAPFLPESSRLPYKLSADSPLFPILFRRAFADSHSPSFKSKLDTFLEKLEHKEGFIPAITSFLSPSLVSDTEESVLTSTAYRILKHGVPITLPVFTSSKREMDLHLSLHPGNYVFKIANVSDFAYMMVCGWKLYSKWNWFKALVDSGMEESKTRMITLPSPWTQAALQVVVVAMEMNKAYRFETDQLDTMHSLLAVQHQYGLVSLDNNEPIDVLKPLFEQCYKHGYDLSQLDPYFVLQLAYDNRDPKYFQQALNHIRESPDTLSFPSLARLSPEVIVLFSSPEALKQWKATLAPEARERIWDQMGAARRRKPKPHPSTENNT